MALDTGDPTQLTDLEVTGVTTLTGVVTSAAGVRGPVQELTATGTVTVTNGTLVLNHATVVIAAVIPALAVGDDLVIFDGSASGTAAHTATLTSPQTYNAVGNTIATLNAPGECLHVRCVATNKLAIIVNTGAVGLS